MPCFLCASEALAADRDFGRERHYRCSADGCGDYLISRIAMSRLEDESGAREALSHRAALLRDTDTLPRIRIGTDEVLYASAVPVASDLG